MNDTPDAPPPPQSTPPSPSPDELPVARVETRSRWAPSLVWLVPLVALIVGGWLAVQAILAQGPVITIEFRSAEGLEAGKTKLKYKDVDIGEVLSVKLSEDRNSVVVRAQLDKSLDDLLVDDTRFWIVKPRIGGSGVSGLGTLLSGAYIGVDAGKSTVRRSDFTGLEVPPIVTSGLPGRSFRLKADDLRSIDYGTPVYFRRLQVGRVVGYELDKNGEGITAQVFVDAPYDQYVTTSTRFWSASGVEVSLGAEGFRMNAESLSSVLLGGIAFGAPAAAPPAPRAAVNSSFTLHGSRDEAMREKDSNSEDVVLVFRESVRGLEVGAPVDFRGIVVGEVLNIGVNYNPQTHVINVPVTVRIYPDRLNTHWTGTAIPDGKSTAQKAPLAALVGSGLRAQLRLGSLITGQLYVALDFFPNARKVALDLRRQPLELPTVDSGVLELQTAISSIAHKLDEIPYQEISADLRQSLKSLDQLVQRADKTLAHVDGDVLPEFRATLGDARKTLDNASRTLDSASHTLDSAGRTLDGSAPLQQDLRETLQEVRRSAQSLRALTDYLERHPEALIRGKPAEDSQ